MGCAYGAPCTFAQTSKLGLWLLGPVCSGPTSHVSWGRAGCSGRASPESSATWSFWAWVVCPQGCQHRPCPLCDFRPFSLQQRLRPVLSSLWLGGLLCNWQSKQICRALCVHLASGPSQFSVLVSDHSPHSLSVNPALKKQAHWSQYQLQSWGCK